MIYRVVDPAEFRTDYKSLMILLSFLYVFVMTVVNFLFKCQILIKNINILNLVLDILNIRYFIKLFFLYFNHT